MIDPVLILASRSPRRNELLERSGIPFSVSASDVDESLPEKISPECAVMTLAERKALAVLTKTEEGSIVLGADTIVYFHGKIIGKPHSREDAVAMLSALSGSMHSVYTGVALIRHIDGETKKDIRFEKTDVRFRKIDSDEINKYIDRFPPFDKAGSYGIQDGAALFVESINGDYNNVIGLPVYKVGQMLKKAGFNW